ncbi:hypothetical protein PHLCEN_2v9343 [Hermanssonia centrifuga]|uniref:Reverse transcriptase RNase H-like domain-containing protein n=1 Tax=Hermanssonia centrifuga TaxID=98765 RepID=A0A2R6NQZ7_9APHY|nr:hypothetical protein PHLCEN_2v9343 [Hermanssonia centrifuga]
MAKLRKLHVLLLLNHNNYVGLIHEKELLAIIQALRKWCVDLLGIPFTVFSEHRTLENFTEQKHLSQRQARWQEFMSQYDYTITYIAGIDNAPADAMSRKPPPADTVPASTVGLIWEATTALSNRLSPPLAAVASVSSLQIRCDSERILSVKTGYLADSWCAHLLDSLWDSVAQAAIVDESSGVSSLEALERGWLDNCARNGVSVCLGMLYV